MDLNSFFLKNVSRKFIVNSFIAGVRKVWKSFYECCSEILQAVS